MPYRERVIESLESHVNGSCAKCKYRESDVRFCFKELLKDAIELLKEQNPVEPNGENCGECGYTLHRINYDGPDKELRHELFRFCPICGKEVKWDELHREN